MENSKVKIFGSSLNPEQRLMAEKLNINLSDQNKIVFLTPSNEFKIKQTNKPIASYNNGLLRMMLEKLILKFPVGTTVVNDNIPEKIKNLKLVKSKADKLNQKVTKRINEN